MPMTVTFLSLMAMEVYVLLAIVLMAVHVPSLPIEFSGERPTENNQEQGDSRFGDHFELSRNVQSPGKHDRSDK